MSTVTSAIATAGVAFTVSWRSVGGVEISAAASLLESDFEPSAKASGRGDCSAREQAGEVQEIQAVHNVSRLDLERGAPQFFAVKLRAGSKVQREIGAHPAAIEIHTAENCRAVLR